MVANSLKMFHQRSSEHTKILSPRILSRQTKHTAAYILHTYTYIDVDVAFQWKCSIFNRPNEITFYTVVCFSCFHFTYNAASTVLIIMYRDAVMFIWAVADVHQLSTVYGLSHRQIQSDIGISLAKFIFARHLRFYKHTPLLHDCCILISINWRVAKSLHTSFVVVDDKWNHNVHNDQLLTISLVFKCYLPIEAHR